MTGPREARPLKELYRWVNVRGDKHSFTPFLYQNKEKTIFLELLKHADVLVENYRPGTLEKLGISAKSLIMKFPKYFVLFS